MKNIVILLICSIIYLISASCEERFGDFLAKAPGVDVTEDTIFSSQVSAESFIANTYYYGSHSIYPYEDQLSGMDGFEGAATDEGECIAAWFKTNQWNVANMTPSNNQDNRFTLRGRAIRYANIIIERINEVPDADQAYKDRVIGEMKFIRAWNNFESFKYYGGVPIVNKRFLIDDNMKTPRSTLEETVNAIVKDCDEAAEILPDAYSANYRGRATKGAALALKSKVLLYAASPLFNTGTPFLNMSKTDNNNLICYGNFDNSRWQTAAEAAKAVIDWAPAGNIALVTNRGNDKNYKYVWTKHDNAEIILATKKNSALAYTSGGRCWKLTLPPSIYSGMGGVTVSMNFIRLYEKTDGTPQTWDMVNGGTDLNLKYSQLDLRFKQSIAYNGSSWNSDYPNVQTFQGGAQANQCYGGTWIHKLIPDEITFASPSYIPNGIIFRLAESYLNYAEALNEAQGPVQAAYDAVNIIRTRSGQPNLLAGLTKEQFRARVWNERAIELFNEEHRLWDLRRWLMAESTIYGGMNGTLFGIKITPVAGSTPQQYRYEPSIIESRTFLRRMYLNPFPLNEVYKGYLIQNPGY